MKRVITSMLCKLIKYLESCLCHHPKLRMKVLKVLRAIPPLDHSLRTILYKQRWQEASREITLIVERHYSTEQANSRLIKHQQDCGQSMIQHLSDHTCTATQIGYVYYWVNDTLNFDKQTGIQRVSRGLACALIEAGIRLIAVKWDEDQKKLARASYADLQFFSCWNGPDPSLWHDWIEPVAAGVTNWFFTAELPLSINQVERSELLHTLRGLGMQCAAIFYDLIPCKIKSLFTEIFVQNFKAFITSLADYDLVLPISLYSHKDLIEYLLAKQPHIQLLQQKIQTVTLPSAFSSFPRVTSYIPATQQTLSILCVCTVEPHKNHETLLKAFKQMCKSSKLDIRLIIVGNPSTFTITSERIRRLVAEDKHVVWESSVDDKQLRAHYIACDFTVYPSIEEGFGLPIVESLWHAKPCICAEFGVMGELAREGGCLTVDVRDVKKLANSLLQMASDSTLRAKLTSEAVGRTFKSWNEYGQEVATKLIQATRTQGAPKSLPIKQTEPSES